MKQNLIIGFIGKDKPGLVRSIADVVIEVPRAMDWSVIGEQLDEIASRLGVEILLEGDTLE